MDTINEKGINMTVNNEDKFYFTAGQMLDILKSFPKELPVLVSGYESGYENFFQPYIMNLKHEPEISYIDGEFQSAEDGDKEVFEAVVLQRVLRD